MAHQSEGSEAAVSTAPVSVAEKAADFENFLFGDEEGEEAPIGEEQEEAEDDDLSLEEGEEESDEADEDSEDEEPDVPAIEAPVSLNAEEKEAFAATSPEVQRAWAASETRRNTQVQEATTKAKEAQRQAEQAAASADRQAEARYAEQLKAYTAAFEPQVPDPARYQDIQSYQRDKAIYDHQKAQHDELMQRVTGIGVETDEMKAERIKTRDAELLKIPEVADEATRAGYIDSAMEAARELGYDPADLAEYMDATDLKALATFAQYKRDSEELSRIKAKSKERRRDNNTGQFKSLKPGAAPQQASRQAKSQKSWKRVKEANGNRAAQSEAMATWLEESGHL